jgi:glycerol-3-phosphate dehydrogenase (NAD(P)+)
MPKVAIIGTTSWGMTLGVVLAHKKVDVRLWARTEREAISLRNTTLGPALPPGVDFPPEHMSVTSSLAEAMTHADAVIIAVPSQSMRQNVNLIAGYLKRWMIIISAAKGLELGTNKRMSQVIAEEIEPQFRPRVCVLSGPNLAAEIMRDLPAATVVAAEKEFIARKAQRLLSAPNLCVYTNSDVVGVELGGALKNIVALGAGMADGLGYGDNAKATFISRGLTEITALAVTLGANPLTLSGLAGLGDLIATCASPLSRNHYLGVELTKGRPLTEITDSMEGIAEGVTTTSAAWDLAQEMGLEMPITEKIYQVLYRGHDPREAAAELMNAQATHELAGRKWTLFSLFRRRRRSA